MEIVSNITFFVDFEMQKDEISCRYSLFLALTYTRTFSTTVSPGKDNFGLSVE